MSSVCLGCKLQERFFLFFVFTVKEKKVVHPPLLRLDTASSILDKYSRKLKKPTETGTRGESLFFDDSDSCKSESLGVKRKKKTSFDGSSFSQRPGMGSIKRIPFRRRLSSDSTKSLSRESLISEGPDHTPHMMSSVVSTVDTKAPRSRLKRPRINEETPKGKPTRKVSRTPEKRGNVNFKVNYVKDKHALEVHLVNATGLPIKRSQLLDSFARISLKTPSKHLRHQSKIYKKTCNPIFDEKFIFESVYFSELQQANLKIKILNRVSVSRCEPIGETAVALCDEDVMRGEPLCRELVEKAGKGQCAGELMVSVCHEATSSHIKVFIMKLKDLPKSVKSPSITVELTYKNEILQQRQVKAKRKTQSINEEFSFEVATNSSFTLDNFGVQFTVYQHDFIRGYELVGQVRLAMDAPLQTEVKHWTAVVLSPHKPIAEWHKLHAPFL